MGGRTRTLTSVLTPQYAPIEQYALDGKQGPWSDIYSAAAVLHHALAGTPPPEAAMGLWSYGPGARGLDQLAGMVSTGAGAFSPVSASVIRIRRNVNTPLDRRSRLSIQYQKSP